MSPIMAGLSFPTQCEAMVIINNHRCNYKIGHWILLALICVFSMLIMAHEETLKGQCIKISGIVTKLSEPPSAILGK